MWAFNIEKVIKTGPETMEVVVAFVNGKNSFNRRFFASRGNFNRSWLEREIKKEVQEFEDRKQFETLIKTGTFTLTAAPPQTPTPEQVKRDEYNAKLIKLTQMNELIILGVITKEDTQTLVDEVKVLATQLGEI